MQLTKFFRSHARLRDQLDAYVDGELRADRREQLEAHLVGCRECAAAVAQTRLVKSSLGMLPERPARRSFNLAPEMVAGAQPTPARGRTVGSSVPAYLAVVRVAAAVSVVAFAAVLTIGLRETSETPVREQLSSASGGTAQDSATGTFSSGAATTSSNRSSVAAATPTLALAPATSGGVSGASAPTVLPEVPQSGEFPTPIALTDLDDTSKSATNPEATALGDALEIGSYAVPGDESSSSGVPWTIVAGCVAGAVVGLLIVLETRRRARA
ncbi:MAG: zf-HC2 domain-containing protein [bacterium]